MAGEVVVTEMSVSTGTISSRSAATTPRVQRAVSDGRGSQYHTYNVDFSVSHYASLPPSTGIFRSINVECMESRYADIASSISDMVRHGLVRAVNVINDDIFF